MDERKTYSPEIRRILERIRRLGPFLKASLTNTRKRCGNPRCRCAREGPLHAATLLTWKEGKKTHTLSVPSELREEVAQWIQEWKTLRQLIDQMSNSMREQLKASRKSTKR
jgi:hypothetical protein